MTHKISYNYSMPPNLTELTLIPNSKFCKIHRPPLEGVKNPTVAQILYLMVTFSLRLAENGHSSLNSDNKDFKTRIQRKPKVGLQEVSVSRCLTY